MKYVDYVCTSASNKYKKVYDRLNIAMSCHLTNRLTLLEYHLKFTCKFMLCVDIDIEYVFPQKQDFNLPFSKKSLTSLILSIL